MFRWILAVTLCLFLAEGSRTALAQNDGAPQKGSSRAGATVNSSPARSGTRPATSSTMRSTTRTRIPTAEAPKKKPSEPGLKPGGGKPGGGKPGGGKPGGGKPGRPGDGWNRPDGSWHRPHHWSRWDRCYPNCYGSYFYDGYYYDDYYYEEEERSRQQTVVQEPRTYFSPGQFEFFEDPRLNWAVEGGLGASPTTNPPPSGTMPSSSNPAQTESDLRQYEQMMKTWR